MNSLGVDPFVNNLYQDLKDGLVLLQVRAGGKLSRMMNYNLGRFKNCTHAYAHAYTHTHTHTRPHAHTYVHTHTWPHAHTVV